ncbi:DUF2510 domain-containing protein [Streptomyces sp. NPDC005805]|uniref:DUF2510 domain-containing protein n=1 Tax=Streptomyces sp. NPDC005805 TaxID=3157068 RepID=UPI0033ED8EA5
MSMTTPPGWYPDAQAPGTERWWDGTAWTAHVRQAPAGPEAPGAAGGFGAPQPGAAGAGPGFGPPDASAPPGAGFGQQSGPAQPGFGQQSGPAQPGFGPAQPAGPGGFGPPVAPAPASGGGSRRTVAPVAAGAVLVAAVVTGAVLLFGKDDEDGGPDPVASGGPETTASAPASPAPGGSATPSAAPSADPDEGRLVDQLNGVSLPMPDGWEKSDRLIGPGATMHTDATYDCPGGGSSLCRHGRVTSLSATPSADATTAKQVAEADIAKAADQAYDEDVLGTPAYGGLRAHKVVKAQNVAVAGRAGYLIRWRVTTGKGPGGHVQTVAFPSTIGTESMVVVRLAFDAGPDGPDLAEMDAITAGIRPIGAAGDTSGGVGSSIGPGD